MPFWLWVGLLEVQEISQLEVQVNVNTWTLVSFFCLLLDFSQNLPV